MKKRCSCMRPDGTQRAHSALEKAHGYVRHPRGDQHFQLALSRIMAIPEGLRSAFACLARHGQDQATDAGSWPPSATVRLPCRNAKSMPVAAWSRTLFDKAWKALSSQNPLLVDPVIVERVIRPGDTGGIAPYRPFQIGHRVGGPNRPAPRKPHLPALANSGDTFCHPGPSRLADTCIKVTRWSPERLETTPRELSALPSLAATTAVRQADWPESHTCSMSALPARTGLISR